MSEKPSPFLNPEELAKRTAEWHDVAAYEKIASRAQYPTYRLESPETGSEAGTVNELHQVSFLDQVIPALLAEHHEKQPLHILDAGGGIGLFADQIQETFGERVEVFTTGIAKKPVRDFRKKITAAAKAGTIHAPQPLATAERALPDNYLRWRSIEQLSDFPEFDLIIDTIGEFDYTKHPVEYWTALIKKLAEGGFASVVCENGHFQKRDGMIKDQEISAAKQFLAEAMSRDPRLLVSVQENQQRMSSIGQHASCLFRVYKQHSDIVAPEQILKLFDTKIN